MNTAKNTAKHAATLAKTFAKATIALTLAALPLCALASPPRPVDITIDCAKPTLPSQQQIAQLTGADNFGQVYDSRAKVMIRAQRACKRGGEQVRVVLELPQPEALPLAKAETTR